VIADKSVDFPALGKPTNPTSARTFNSKVICFSSSGIPGWEYLGVWFVGDLKCQFPLPPLPPLHIIFSSASSVISKIISLGIRISYNRT